MKGSYEKQGMLPAVPSLALIREESGLGASQHAKYACSMLTSEFWMKAFTAPFSVLPAYLLLFPTLGWCVSCLLIH